MLNGRTALRLLRIYLILWRIDAMYKQTMNVAKGIGMGVLAGTVVAAIGAKAMEGNHRKAAHMKKRGGRAINTVVNLFVDVYKLLN